MRYKTTEQARDYFKDSGLKYSDIEYSDYRKLREFIKSELKTNQTELELKLNRTYKDFHYKDDNTMLSCFVYVDGFYFKKREAISFNSNGFIGFAGWASSNNSEPIIEAFIKWVDSIK